MTDNYEYNKSMRVQQIGEYSPYTDKQYNGYINDLNSGVYTNNSLNLIQYDLGQIYNSQKFTNTEDMFVVLPITMVAAFAAAGSTVGISTTVSYANLRSLKAISFTKYIRQTFKSMDRQLKALNLILTSLSTFKC